ncbi:hypothetical protein KIL84_019723 [Mauremys mutica]|uniref:Uncharacterized protein n=1 Tax=Mauremys mutica TaxID=74926 RepID=A0A9D4BBI2_9SAUR|nr:hypothetical protein KIL84_019723 [Mauremys mutica]
MVAIALHCRMVPKQGKGLTETQSSSWMHGNQWASDVPFHPASSLGTPSAPDAHNKAELPQGVKGEGSNAYRCTSVFFPLLTQTVFPTLEVRSRENFSHMAYMPWIILRVF